MLSNLSASWICLLGIHGEGEAMRLMPRFDAREQDELEC